eukprot:TRINITY_DN12506_c0_g1_i1.p1 TRINITY_DN12506_c0_g1~~TRINITY_DN12506_c0_g1_i1.p1  ORF type:complete len:197 (+),score=69.16 TRINITY_DN12506_c0_g1_i1:130-720(+)
MVSFKLPSKSEDDDQDQVTGFGKAMSTILAKEIDADDHAAPILFSDTYIDDKIKEEKMRLQQDKKAKVDKKLIMNKDYKELSNHNENWNQERSFKKMATKGVVQLFNAVAKQNPDSIATKNTKKVEQLTREKFLELLHSAENTETETVTVATEEVIPDKVEGEEETPNWSALSENFLLGATVKDWNLEMEDEELIM